MRRGPPRLSTMDKRYLVEQLINHLRRSATVARHERAAATVEIRDGASAAEKREEGRSALELSGLAHAQSLRAQRASAEADVLAGFCPPPHRQGAPIAIGALVEIEDTDTGDGRTFFLAPVGAGIVLTPPGGDGFFATVTPVSPVGRAVLGKRCGDTVDVTVGNECREWEITWVG